MCLWPFRLKILVCPLETMSSIHQHQIKHNPSTHQPIFAPKLYFSKGISRSRLKRHFFSSFRNWCLELVPVHSPTPFTPSTHTHACARQHTFSIFLQSTHLRSPLPHHLHTLILHHIPTLAPTLSRKLISLSHRRTEIPKSPLRFREVTHKLSSVRISHHHFLNYHTKVEFCYAASDVAQHNIANITHTQWFSLRFIIFFKYHILRKWKHALTKKKGFPKEFESGFTCIDCLNGNVVHCGLEFFW